MATGNLTYVAGTKQGTYWVRVGHQSSSYNNDAVWSFTPPTANGLEKYTSVTFRLTWNCTSSTGGPGSGWQGSFSYVFAVSTSNAAGRTAATGTHLGKVTKSLSGYTGATDVTVSGLSLTPGTTYYLRANMNGTTYSTMKAFYLDNAKAVADQSTSGITDPGVTWNATEEWYQLTVQYNANGGTITTGTGTTRYRVSSNLVQKSEDSGSTWATLTLTSGSQGNWNLHNVTGTGYDGGVKKTGYHVVSTQEFNTNAAGTGNTINMENGNTNAATIYRMNGNAYLTADKTISLYVKWVADTYTISYNKGANGTGTNTTDTKTYGVALTLKGAIFTRTGYTQTGWSTTDGGAKVYDLSASYTTNAATTLYPYWTINTWTVGYNANGHGTAPASQTKTYNVALTLQPFISNVNGTESTVTITGDNSNGDSWSGSNGSAKWRPVYSQTYWNTNSSGTGTNYGSGASYTGNAALSLYAIWKTTNTGTSYTLPTGTPVKNNTTSSSMTVTFNPNGGSTTKTSQGSVKTTTYTFKGWFTAASGGTQRTTSSRVTAAETVYSQFTGTTSAQAAVTLPTAAQCTKQGYTLLGWSTSDTATTASYAPGASYTPTASIILYAVWKANTYTHVYSGGEWKLAPVYIYQGGSWKEISTVIKIYNGTKWTEV